MPTSVMKAVPPGMMRASAVGTCVCVPITALTLPSNAAASACFSERRLGVDVDEDGVRALQQGACRDLALHCQERVVQRIHENAAESVHHQDLGAVRGPEQPGARTRRADGIVERPQQAVLPRDEYERLPLVPNVVASGDNIGTGVVQVLENLLGYAKAARRVFAVDDNEVGGETLTQGGKLLAERIPP